MHGEGHRPHRGITKSVFLAEREYRFDRKLEKLQKEKERKQEYARRNNKETSNAE